MKNRRSRSKESEKPFEGRGAGNRRDEGRGAQKGENAEY